MISQRKSAFKRLLSARKKAIWERAAKQWIVKINRMCYINPFSYSLSRDHAAMNVHAGTIQSQSARSSDHGLTLLLEKVYAEKGWDFRGYKRTTLSRRVTKLLHASRASSYGDPGGGPRPRRQLRRRLPDVRLRAPGCPVREPEVF